MTVPAAQSAAISLVKSASLRQFSLPGTKITYRFKVTNTGNVTLNPVIVTDPLKSLSAISCPKTSLAVKASATCTATYKTTRADVARGFIRNTATAIGTASSGRKVAAKPSVRIGVREAPKPPIGPSGPQVTG